MGGQPDKNTATEKTTEEKIIDDEGQPDKNTATDKTTEEKIIDDEGQPDKNTATDKTTEEKIIDDEEMCPDIKKWLLGGSLENNCAYTSSGCPRCFGKTHRCSFDYKKKGCDKKTITNKKDAVQELVDMKLISKEDRRKKSIENNKKPGKSIALL